MTVKTVTIGTRASRSINYQTAEVSMQIEVELAPGETATDAQNRYLPEMQKRVEKASGEQVQRLNRQKREIENML